MPIIRDFRSVLGWGEAGVGVEGGETGPGAGCSAAGAWTGVGGRARVGFGGGVRVGVGVAKGEEVVIGVPLLGGVSMALAHVMGGAVLGVSWRVGVVAGVGVGVFVLLGVGVGQGRVLSLGLMVGRGGARALPGFVVGGACGGVGAVALEGLVKGVLSAWMAVCSRSA